MEASNGAPKVRHDQVEDDDQRRKEHRLDAGKGLSKTGDDQVKDDKQRMKEDKK